jgi:hypothetical protein
MNGGDVALARARRVSLLLALAVVLALLSVRIERRGPEQVVYGNVCGRAGSDLCYRPVLKGGFPVAYLFDAPGVSVEDQLAFIEDNFQPVAFTLDVALYFAVATLGFQIVARRLVPRPRRRT